MASTIGFIFMGGGQHYDEERKERVKRLLPVWRYVEFNEIPRVPRETILGYINDLKDEGNALFKEKDYRGAGQHYATGVNFAKILQDFHYYQVDRKLLSSLICNRAFCFLKMDVFDAAIEDCDLAISLNKENIKAYYRKAQSEKSLKQYKEALTSAENGKSRAEASENTPDVALFEGLIREIKSHLPAQNQPLITPAHPDENNSSPAGSRLSQYKSAANNNADRKPYEEESKKTKSASASVLTSNTAGKIYDFDESWLEGTNVAIGKKSVKRQEHATNNKNKKIGKKPDYQSSPKKVTSNQRSAGEKRSQPPQATERVSSTDKESSEDEESTEEESSSDEVSDVDSPAGKASKKNNGKIEDELAHIDYIAGNWQNTKSASKQKVYTGAEKKMMDLDNFSLPAMPSSYESPTHTNNATWMTASPRKKNGQAHQPIESKPDYQMPPPATKPFTNPNMQYQLKPASPIPSSFQPREAQKQYVVESPSKAAPAKRLVDSPEKSSATLLQEPDSHLLSQFRRKPLQYPFTSLLDHKLVCSMCYVKVSDGINGHHLLETLPHECQHNILLVKYKAQQAKWMMIRLRHTNFNGDFKLCHHFMTGQACRVGESRCAFVHGEEEKQLWTMDRAGQINISEFIMEEAKTFKAAKAKLRERATSQERVMQTKGRSSPVNSSSFLHNQPKTNTMSSMNATSPATPTYRSAATPASYNNVAGKMPVPRPQTQQGVRLTSSSAAQGQGQRMQAPPGGQYVYQTKLQAAYPTPAGESHEVNSFLQQCNYKVVCGTCLQPTVRMGVYSVVTSNHKCDENILILQRKGDMYWMRIRQRKSHRMFSGKYKLCYHFCAEVPRMCSVGEQNCVFAHNELEQEFWTLEKDGKISIQEFMLENRSSESSRTFSAAEIFRNHGGTFHFICRKCFYGHPAIISVKNPINKNVCSGEHHIWNSSKILIHFDPSGRITPIADRPFKHKEAFFLLCRNQQFCARRAMSACKFAHSFLERDVWILERDLNISRDNIVAESEKYQAAILQQATPTTDDPSRSSTPQQGHTASAAQSSQAASLPPKPAAALTVKCPFKVIFVCGLCWKQGLRNGKEPSKDRCVGKGSGHQWLQNRVCLLLTQGKAQVVRPLPQKIPSGYRFRMCQHVLQKKKCDYAGSRCQFAHSEDEIKVWTWQMTNNVKSQEDLVSSSEKSHAQPASKIAKGQTVVAAKPVLPQTRKVATPWERAVNTHYCHYCGIQCNGDKQWENHCASDKHNFNVNSDKEHQWNFRQPPWGVANGNYELCERHADGRRGCNYSNKPDMYNYCKFAHSVDELDEWRERWEWRMMKRSMAQQDKMYSYMDEVLHQYNTAESGVLVIAEELKNVVVKCDTELSLIRKQKNCSQQWTFTVKPKDGQKLQKVALLHDKDRLHFNLKHDDLDRSSQLASGDVFLKVSQRSEYEVIVMFSGGMFGSFSQWLLFDFGSRPLLVKKLNMEVTNQFVQEKVERLRAHLHFDRWTSDNREIVKFQSSDGTTNTFKSQMLQQYKSPSNATAVITHESVGRELNRHNYVHKMHQLLELEEITRHRIISSYNLKTQVEVVDRINEETMIFARRGEMFARVPLNEQLSEDTDAGKLILTSVQTVLIARQQTTPTSAGKVYQAILVQKENFDYDGRGLDYIYLCLSPAMCKDLVLRNNELIDIELQFQMDRLPFCLMHYTLEQLQNNDVVFPDLGKINPGWNEKHTLKLSSTVLNKDQMKIVQHIVAERTGYSPPLIIYGPFGTGKTETIAQATMLLNTQRPDARILICTHSNSAADLYITKHFDQFIKRGHPMLLRRVYYEERRVTAVHPSVQQYCQLAPDHTCFLPATEADVRKHQVVITTLSTSLVFCRLGLQGYFSHIFIDEGGQALECEAIMPFSLANDSTCILLAGDHMQMSPKVYSTEGREQRFHRSLLERLYNYYDAYAPHLQASNLNILLSINYRSKMEIVRFISAIFYGGPDKLVSQSNDVNVEGIKPLTFYTAQGREVQDSDSTSYYNISECEEITDRVEELFNNWPSEWGERQANQIGVVTAYYDQMWKIRTSLRKRRKELRDVTVERVMNVPGREFRALFISTVRTRHLAEKPPKLASSISECDGDVGDFGFLSDQKLLNTALTRAQSLVAVVGDPVALCSIGECMSIWRTFLKHCQNMSSLFPHTITLDSIKAQVQSLMNSRHGENLIKLAAATQPSTSQAAAAQATTESESGASSSGIKTESELQTAREKFLDEWDLDYRIEPDEILQQLAKEAMRNNRTAQKGQSEAKSAASAMEAMANDEPLKIECIKVKEEAGHAIVHYNPNWGQSARKRHLMGANDYDAEFESESDMSDDEESPGRSGVYINYSNNQLLNFLRNEPNKYKRCILHIESSRKMFAINVERSVNVDRQIVISSRLRCGRGFDNDEVVVEILNEDEEEKQGRPETEEQKVQGQVIGILKRAINPKYRTFVCMVEQGNTGLMVPLNRGIPKIYNLETKQRLTKTKKGHVTVYTFTKDHEINFHHYESVDPENQSAKLFLVRYLKWEAKFYSPLGIVVGVLPPGDTMEQGNHILDIEHSIPKKFKDNVLKDVDQVYKEGYTLPPSVFGNRLDYRDKLVFTIDPAGSLDLDDALSVDTLPGGDYLISVHIADVSHFIRRDSNVDLEAYARGTSYYPIERDMIPMIPHLLSTDLCSLKPQQDRLVLSVIIHVDKDNNVKSMRPKRCVINSKFRLHYEDVEEVLQNTGKSELPSKLCDDIKVLHSIASVWRQRRLGNASLYHPLEDDSKETPLAHILVEEMMICANQQVALLLLKHFPDCTPIRHQLPPDEIKLQEWRKKNAQFARNTPALTRPFLYQGFVCNCEGLCMCVPTPSLTNVQVLLDTWKEISKVADKGDLDLLTQLLVSPENHPQLAVALLHLYNLQENSVYVCSGDVSSNHQWHYSLNLPAYCHFTSPIRRYIDLVAHRQLVAIIEDQPCPYSQVDMTAICARCTDMTLKAKRFEKATMALHLAVKMKENPLILLPVVDSVDDSSLLLRFPTVKQIVPSRGNVKLTQLKPSERPVCTDDMLDLKFQKRIYDVVESRSPCAKSLVVDNKKYVLEIPAMHWLLLLQCLKERNLDDLRCHIQDIQMEVSTIRGPDADVSSEVPPGGIIEKHFCNVQLGVLPGSVVKVQVVSGMFKGMLSPSLQLINLTPRLDLCVDHQINPVECFAGTTTIRGTRTSYKDPETYEKSWLPLLAMEACHGAIANDDSAIIHNVPIRWQEESTRSGILHTGLFSLSLGFCKDRQIYFSMDSASDLPPWALDEEFYQETLKSTPDQCFDYLCVRYDKSANQEMEDDTVSAGRWVGHCYTSRVIVTKERSKLSIQIKLNHSREKLPAEMLRDNRAVLCTVEWISRPLPMRRMEAAVKGLAGASDLARDIALGTLPDKLDLKLFNLKDIRNKEIPYLCTPNQSQDRAIQTALSEAFTLIQGPPGTGKTEMGVRLAYLFTEVNKQVTLRKGKSVPQVLYCGPSNKSVDVVTEKLMSLKEYRPRIVRVYSSQIAFSEFPVPGKILMKRNINSADLAVNENLKGVALHHMIRDPSLPGSALIREIDQLIRTNPTSVSRDQLDEYMSAISCAETDVLKQAQIILCTCTASASYRIRNATNIRQLIIDECGMCMEPEAMVPIVNSHASQVVLIGDHKQLRPIVLHERARNLGLEKSLFERYADKAIMLNTQYRMHESICQFPSQHFYEGQLKCGLKEQSLPSPQKFWPNGRNKTFAFCNVIGREETQQVATSDGNEQSKANKSEVHYAVRYAKLLVDRYRVKAKDVVILSQYRAQCAAIKEGLESEGHADISVSTVVKSQGSEWDYVIISTVRSLPKCEVERHPTNGWRRANLGFIIDNHQINVAITRARKGLIIIGNKHLLKADPMWAHLLEYYKNNKNLVEADQFMALK